MLLPTDISQLWLVVIVDIHEKFFYGRDKGTWRVVTACVPFLQGGRFISGTGFLGESKVGSGMGSQFMTVFFRFDVSRHHQNVFKILLLSIDLDNN